MNPLWMCRPGVKRNFKSVLESEDISYSSHKIWNGANILKAFLFEKIGVEYHEMFLKGGEFLSENKVSMDGRVAFVTPEFYRLIKLDPAFTLVGNMANELKLKGLVGMIDNCAVVMTPKAYMRVGEPDIET